MHYRLKHFQNNKKGQINKNKEFTREDSNNSWADSFGLQSLQLSVVSGMSSIRSSFRRKRADSVPKENPKSRRSTADSNKIHLALDSKTQLLTTPDKNRR